MAAAAAPAAPDPLDRLKKLEELRASGVLTADEFESKKASLLAEI
jgi:Short C-terminal domain